jgi:hypothetical protein
MLEQVVPVVTITVVFCLAFIPLLYNLLDRAPNFISSFVERFLQSRIFVYILVEDRDRTNFRNAETFIMLYLKSRSIYI